MTSSPDRAPGRFALALLRIVGGFFFLWPALDKTFGWGFPTPASKSWLQGTSPTKGYLSSSFGPLGGMFRAMAGNPVVDFLFIAGLAAVGIALLLGVATRLGGWGGVAMLLLMYASHPALWFLQPAGAMAGNNPILDDHQILGACAMAMVAIFPSGEMLGLGRLWRSRVHARWLQ